MDYHHTRIRLSALTFGWFFGLAGLLLLLPLQVQAQDQNGITQPAAGDILTGVVVIQGTAASTDFLRFELAFLQEAAGSNDWIVFAQGDQPVFNGTLAVWDTTVGRGSNRIFPDGRYQLRLRVVRTDYNYLEYFVQNLTIANDTVTPSPTPTITPTAGTATAAPLSTIEPGATAAGVPAVLPSLTPFPTPSPRPTAVGGPAGADRLQDDQPAGETGLLAQFQALDLSPLGQAFRFGVTLAVYIFGFLAAYLVLRAIGRRLWRAVASRRQ
jgi:hypothetical protein